MTYLLDVNVLVALIDPNHVGHEAAHHWFETEGGKAWATCPINENRDIGSAAHTQGGNRGRGGDPPYRKSLMRTGLNYLLAAKKCTLTEVIHSLFGCFRLAAADQSGRLRHIGR